VYSSQGKRGPLEDPKSGSHPELRGNERKKEKTTSAGKSACAAFGRRGMVLGALHEIGKRFLKEKLGVSSRNDCLQGAIIGVPRGSC